MHDELTQVDIDKMKEELQHRIQVLRPQLIEEVKVARSFGDLSENFEYKAAKREKNRNDSRIRYLENMIKTAVVIDGTAAGDGVALFDKVTFYLEEEETEETIQLVTTLRQDALKGLISKESPVGKALLGHQVGDRVCIHVSDSYHYYVQIRKIEKTGEDPDIPISTSDLQPADFPGTDLDASLPYLPERGNLLRGSFRGMLPSWHVPLVFPVLPCRSDGRNREPAGIPDLFCDCQNPRAYRIKSFRSDLLCFTGGIL